jgi:hypothetical protein
MRSSSTGSVLGPPFPSLTDARRAERQRNIKAKYHPATDVLTVHSGHITDTLTLLLPHGTHFATASDHHGGTDVFLVFA